MYLRDCLGKLAVPRCDIGGSLVDKRYVTLINSVRTLLTGPNEIG
jgi:hypothetical protein